MDLVRLQRDFDVRGIPFTSLGIDGPGPPNIVLSSNDLDLEEEVPGLRITVTHLIKPGTDLELTYQGLFNWSAIAQVSDSMFDPPANNLYSVFSQFGVLPEGGGGGFEETDQAFLHRIAYSGNLNGVELNRRQRWITSGCRFQGSKLLGARYLRISEDFVHTTWVQAHDDPLTPGINDPFERGPGQAEYYVEARNDMVGFQAGGDFLMCLCRRIMLGADGKAGFYVNHSQQRTNFRGSQFGTVVEDKLSDESMGAMGEANLFATLRIGRRATLRVGYQVLYLQSVALALHQFNEVVEDLADEDRNPFLDNDDKVYFYGGTAGFEWTW